MKHQVLKRKAFGMGLDLDWDSEVGFQRGANASEDGPTAGLTNALLRQAGKFDHFFFAFQPKNRNLLSQADYEPAYRRLMALLPEHYSRGFHQTVLNLGSLDEYPKDQVIAFTNDVCRTHNLKYVNEDLGVWSLEGKSLPYPLPPLLTEEGLNACARNIQEYQQGLIVPLLVEFPGFTEACSFILGDLNAYDFFNDVAQKSGCLVTLDTGHLLGYQWFTGKRGDSLYDDLDRLPLDRVVEIHLSGCGVVNGAFRDLHHGVLMPEQVELADRLLKICPNVESVVFEDPKFQSNGELISQAQDGFDKLKEVVQRWRAR